METKISSSSGIWGDLLYTVWEEQRRYNNLVKAQTQIREEDWPSTYVLGLLSECDELLSQTDWKRHRTPNLLRQNRPIARDNIASELADITKYVLSLWQEFGFQIGDMLEAVDRKSRMMGLRLQQEFGQHPTNRVVIIADIDGTLADFVGGLRNYLVGCGLVLAHADGGLLDLDVQMGLGYPEYWRLKDAFESSGGYRHLPAYVDGIELVKNAQRAGAYLVCVTARPKEIKRVWYDSWLWLEECGIRPDQLLLGETERVLLVKRYLDLGNRVLVLEDNPSLALRAAALCPVLMRAHKYNDNTYHQNIYRMSNFEPTDWESCVEHNKLYR